MVSVIIAVLVVYLVWVVIYLLLKTLGEAKLYWRIYFLVVFLLSIGGGLAIGRTYWIIAHQDLFSEMIWSIFPVQRYYFISGEVTYHWLSTLPWIWWQFNQGIDYFMGIVGTLGILYILYVRVVSKIMIIPRRDILLPKLYNRGNSLIMIPLVIIVLGGIILFPVEFKEVLLLAMGVSLLIRFSIPKYTPVSILLIIFVHRQSGEIYLWLMDIVLIVLLTMGGIYWRKLFDPLIKMIKRINS